MFEKDYGMDLAELYRENYQDALDEIRNLKYKIAELESVINENKDNMIFIKRED